jgi:hypothetical protein
LGFFAKKVCGAFFSETTTQSKTPEQTHRKSKI